MEEDRERKKRIIYLIFGIVLSLFVTIGSTFAYFSSSVSSTGDNITGFTNNNVESELSITTSRLNLNPNPSPSSDNLVPAYLGTTSSTNIVTDNINDALNKKCVNNGYTGCHVWKITASSTSTVTSANIKLNLQLVGVKDKNEWTYVVYTGTDTRASNIVFKGQIIITFPNEMTTLDINNGGSITGGVPKVYYLMVYLNNIDVVQNDGVTVGTTDARGSYNGNVTLETLGGKVKAEFFPE